MMKERNIPEEWVWQTIRHPDSQNISPDNNVHYFKCISEFEKRILHVVVNTHSTPQKVVTVFFDRRERNKK